MSIRIWGDERFVALSPPRPNAQTLFLYLLTGPHTGVIPGLSVAGPAQLAEALGWPLRAFRACLGEITTACMAIVDERVRLIYLPNGKYHNPPGNPNIVVGWREAFDDLPDCALKVGAFADFLAYLTEGFTEAFQQPFLKPLGKAFDEACGKGLPNSISSSSRSRNNPPVSPLSASPVDKSRQNGIEGDAAVAWTRVTAALRAGVPEPEFLDPAIPHTITAMGGWVVIRDTQRDAKPTVALATKRKEFMQLYPMRATP